MLSALPTRRPLVSYLRGMATPHPHPPCTVMPVAGACIESGTEQENIPEMMVLPATSPVLKREIATLQIQAGEAEETASLAPMPVDTIDVRQENVVFAEESVPNETHMPSTIDETRVMDQDATAALSEYLSRPVKIHDFSWLESDTFSTSPIEIHPWELYFNNTYIKRKLENFARLNCTLKVTFRFNASPFYYGLMRVAYDPMNTDRLKPLGVADLIPISQAPGVWIEPHKESSVTMTLPFLWPHNWLSIGNKFEFRHMGKFMFTLYAPLQSANGVSGTGITISTYVQAENVTIAGPTVIPALQAGVVSGPATAVANFARALSSVPEIGPFARAIDIGARAVGTIAALFGYSNPPVTANVKPVQPKAFHAFANVETSMPIDKLALDPENQVTIDNSVAGGDSKDPLIISDLVQKVSYFGQTTWTDSDSVGTKLFTMAVTPGLMNWESTTGGTYWRMPAMAWVSSMFRYWHGSIKITVKVVKSRYHKGRLLVCWDPGHGIPPAGAETALFTQIIDLSSEQDEFEFLIPYKATQPWLRGNQKSDGFVVRGDATLDESVCNGYVAVYVQNTLTGPAASPSVNVIMSVAGGPDLQFAVPATLQQNVTTLAIQSGTVDAKDHEVSEKLNVITVGETIASLRPLLHRATFSYSQIVGSKYTGAATFVPVGYHSNTNFFPRMPLPFGFDTTHGVSWAQKYLSSGAAPFNYAASHPINWVLMGFVGYRGSTVIHGNLTQVSNIPSICNFTATRTHESHIPFPNTTRNRYTGQVNNNSVSSLSRFAVSNLASNHLRRPWGHGGMSLTNTKTQAALSVNIPMYSQWKFQPAWANYRDFVPYAEDRNTGNRSYDNVRFDSTWVHNAAVDSATQWPVLDLYYAAGVDFQPVYFVGIPRVVNLTLPNANDDYTPATS